MECKYPSSIVEKEKHSFKIHLSQGRLILHIFLMYPKFDSFNAVNAKQPKLQQNSGQKNLTTE